MGRNFSLAIRYPLMALAVLAPFFLPLPFTIAVALVAGYFFPPLVFIVGILLDALYFGGRFGEHGVPWYTVVSAGGALALFLVREFVRTRIIS